MNTSYDILFQISPRSSDQPETYDARILEFGHYLIPLLPAPGTVRDWTIDAVCCLVERIYRPVFMMCRQEIAVLPLEPDFFSNAPGLANLRRALWEMIEDATRLRWIILTRHPEIIAQALPPNWGGKGYGNVCLGIVVDNTAGFPRQLNELRNTVARFRMLLITPPAHVINLTGCLDKIDWVVFAGNSDDAAQADAMNAVCREANVAFLFHQLDTQPSTLAHDEPQPNDCEQQWPKHPFGPEVQLDRHAHPSLKPALDALQELFAPRPITSQLLEMKPTHTMSETESQSPTPTIMSESTDHDVTAESIIHSTAPGLENPAVTAHEHPGPAVANESTNPESLHPISSAAPEDVVVATHEYAPLYAENFGDGDAHAPAETTTDAVPVDNHDDEFLDFEVLGTGSSLKKVKTKIKNCQEIPRSSNKRKAVQGTELPAQPQNAKPHDGVQTKAIRAETDFGNSETTGSLALETVQLASPGALSHDDLTFREERESIVTAGVKMCIAAGIAMYQIYGYREGVLWQLDYKSFAAYGKSKWGYSKSQTYRLLQIGEFVDELRQSPNGDRVPMNEGQIRPLLAAVPKEDQIRCWLEIVREMPPADLTGKIVGTRVRKYLEEKGLPTKARRLAKAKEQPANATDYEQTMLLIEQLRSLMCKVPHPDSLEPRICEISLGFDPTAEERIVRVIDTTIKIWKPDAIAS